ncbi:hypothetical protein CRENBAI_002679 [Crenichthys baileyi]|uniref:Uncharacterized protein n=1 Tax=Crenichthys baileyi TaxID=28760 RepID=A0AAV9SFL0_9TELE
MPLPAPCLTSLVPIIDPLSVPGLLNQPSPWIIQPKVTCLSHLRCGDPWLLPTEVSHLGFKFNPRKGQSWMEGRSPDDFAADYSLRWAPVCFVDKTKPTEMDKEGSPNDGSVEDARSPWEDFYLIPPGSTALLTLFRTVLCVKTIRPSERGSKNLK